MHKKYVVDFKSCMSHDDVIRKLNFVFSDIEVGDVVDITLDFYAFRDFIYPDYAALIVVMIDCARSKAESISGRIINLKKKSSSFVYLERMNFFHLIGADFVQQNTASPEGDYLMITRYLGENHSDVIDNIIRLIKKNLSSINENVLLSLDYCLGEILDNIINYSEKGHGWVVAQFFSSTNKIRLIICDTGVGIPCTLNANKSGKEKLKKEQVLFKCVEKLVTGGKGQGHGLFATATFVEENRGALKIYSEDCMLDFKNFEDRKVNATPFWNGTVVFLDINTNVDVDYKKFTSEVFDQKEYFKECSGLW